MNNEVTAPATLASQRYDHAAATWQELAGRHRGAPRTSKPDRFKPGPGQHADGARGSITRIFRETRELGYAGSCPACGYTAAVTSCRPIAWRA